ITQSQINGNTTIQGVIFDLDGVLLDSEWMAFKAWCELAGRYGGKLEETAFSEMVGTTAEQTAEIVMRRTGITVNISESVTWAWRHVNEQIRLTADPLPGAIELIQYLATLNLPLAIASNSPTVYINDALSGLNLSAYFPVRVGIDQVAEGKPAPDVYLRAAGQIGVIPKRCLVIEDSRVGVQAAAAANMRVLAVPGERDHTNGFHQAWRIYPSLLKVREDLPQILA
ncbi:MAG: HAD family phosphatase, partial [Anaerolineaceae bacterium]|nr:HAD family phosphatase [Anaerolineaceae bacterium]